MLILKSTKNGPPLFGHTLFKQDCAREERNVVQYPYYLAAAVKLLLTAKCICIWRVVRLFRLFRKVFMVLSGSQIHQRHKTESLIES